MARQALRDERDRQARGRPDEAVGFKAAQGLGATLLPQLAEGDLRVQPGDVEAFAGEYAVLAANLAVLSAASGYDEVRAAERAQQAGGGVLIW